MSKKKSKKSAKSFKEKSAAKRAVFMETEKKKSPLSSIVMVFCAVLVILAGVFLFKQMGKTPTVALAKEVTHPVSLFADGKARHFQLQTEGGIVVKYFVLKSSDGVIRAAFDACDVCWREGKGYYQKGDHMVCVNCGRRFASVKVNEVKGGCNPAPLTREVRGNEVVIERTDILEGRQYFDFSKRS